jgi:biotin transport system substrate-specific component
MVQIATAPLADLAGRRAWRHAAVVLIGSWVLAASSRIEVPMIPVPMTMQTYALLLIAGLAGLQLSLEIVIAWLMQAAIGWPVLAGGAGGLAPFVGPTAGYLLGFVVAAGLIGWARDTGRAHEPASFTAWCLAAHGVILGLGWAWLAILMGSGPAFAGGVTPFLIGSVLKSALAAASIALAIPRRRP